MDAMERLEQRLCIFKPIVKKKKEFETDLRIQICWTVYGVPLLVSGVLISTSIKLLSWLSRDYFDSFLIIQGAKGEPGIYGVNVNASFKVGKIYIWHI